MMLLKERENCLHFASGNFAVFTEFLHVELY